MLTGLTRREQRILLFLIGVITVGLAIHHIRTRSHRDIWVTSPETEEDHQKESVAERISEETPLSPPPLININTASFEELCSLHGIGAVKAKTIIDYRNTHKGFQALREITKVPGIGMSTFDNIKERITVGEVEPVRIESENAGSSETVGNESNFFLRKEHPRDTPTGRVNINSDGLEELMTLEQIGEIKAQRILEYRARYGPFRSVKDLLKIKGIGEKTLSLNRDKISLGGD